jgi:peptide/nickel transport system permease protein
VSDKGDTSVSQGGSTAKQFLLFVTGRASFLVGYLIVLGFALIGAMAPVLPLHSPTESDASAYLEAPSLSHPMGTDSAGLDILSRVLHAPRVDLVIALVSTAGAAVVGSLLGALAGLWQGRGGIKEVLALVIVRSADVIQAFPVFALSSWRSARSVFRSICGSCRAKP